MRCDEIRDRSTVERYLAGRLEPEEEQRFEEHYLGCERCQQELELGMVLRSEFAQPGEGGTIESGQGRRWAVGAALAAVAALIVAVVLLDAGHEPNTRELGRVTALPESPDRGLATTGDPRVDSLMASGLQAYQDGDHDVAAQNLEAALLADENVPTAAFYLGTSLLARERPEEAADAFRKVVQTRDTAYADAARYYLAKALLWTGRVDEALDELRRVDRTAAYGNRAASLEDSLQALLRGDQQ